MALQNSQDRFNGVVASLAIKAPCKSVSDGDGNILLQGEQTVGGIALVAGDRVLLIEQTDPIENGIWCVDTSAWARTADFDGNRDVAKGTLVTVNRPPNNLTSYVQVNLGVANDEPTIGTDPLAFSIFFSQLSNIDDLGDVDTTGCTDDDLMYWSGGVLICTLGALTYDGNELLSDGNIGIKGFNNAGPTLRAKESLDLIATLNPRRNDQYTGIGGAFGNLDFLHDNNGLSSFLGLRLRKQADLFSTRSWNVEGIAASTTQTQGQSPVKSTLVRVTAVANPNDVITLRQPELGMDQIVMNRGANVLQVFPESGDDLGFGTDVSITIQPGGAIWWLGIDADTWHIAFVGDGSGSVPGAFRGAKAFSTTDFNPPLISGLNWDTGAGLGAVPFNSEVFDTDTIHDNAVNNSRLTTPAGISKVILRAGATLTEADTGGMHMRFRLNGVENSCDPGMPNYSPHATHGSWGSKGFGVPDDANVGFTLNSGVIEVANPGTDYFELYAGEQSTVAVFRGGKHWFGMEIIE